MYISQSWTSSAFCKRKAWFRSPYQRKKPVREKRKASAAVTITLSFWPALKRPCGLPRQRSQPRSSSSKTSISRASASSRRRSPARMTRAKAAIQASAVYTWMSFSSGRRRISGSVAVRAPDPGVLVVAVLFPVAAWLLGDELHLRQPFDSLVAVHLRQDHAGRGTMGSRERLAAQLERQHRVRQPELIERERVLVGLLERDEANSAPVDVLDRPAGDTVKGRDLLCLRQRGELAVSEALRPLDKSADLEPP